MNHTHRSPVLLQSTIDQKLSRWFWLVKMFLAIPHFVILVFLGIAFIATTVFAGIAILITGRYPRPLFDFNVGVMRWNWRVGFYVYAALGTDTYPPFTLSPADYPAGLDIDYPERLSRGLVFVKSWLLALPHLIIVGLFFGVFMLYPWDAVATWQGTTHPVGGYSVFNILVAIAGILLLITGRYPRSLYDFLLGLNRWLYRVLAYVALMTDQYPPFRLDTGEEEPADHDAVEGGAVGGSAVTGRSPEETLCGGRSRVRLIGTTLGLAHEERMQF